MPAAVRMCFLQAFSHAAVSRLPVCLAVPFLCSPPVNLLESYGFNFETIIPGLNTNVGRVVMDQ